MTSPHFRQIVQARHRCELNPQMHIGRPVNIRPASQRQWWRLGR
jgi:hypothetical protein